MSLFPLTSNQQKAASNLKGNLQIIACAGSGKTEVVSRRIANLISNGAIPKSIVAFTFTVKAAEELKARIREILDIQCPKRADIGDMYVGTIHSFCFEMLKELNPVYRGYDALDEPKRYAFISMPHRYYNSHIRSLEENGKHQAIVKFLESWDIARSECLNIDRISNKDFVEAVKRYENFLEEDRYLDFTYMIYKLVELLDSDPEIKTALNKRVKHLVVDEYQDVNVVQEKLIRHISDGVESLCVVGDDDQCIYHWRGSTVENIIKFSKNYPKVTTIPLEHNFRSTKCIIDAARCFIERNNGRLKKEFKPRDPPVNESESDDLFYKQFDSEDDELEFIVKRINDLIGSGCKDKKSRPFSLNYGDFAVLTRTNKMASKVITRLDEAGIPLIVDAGNAVFDRPEVNLCIMCLAYLFDLEYRDTSIDLKDLLSGYNSVFVNREYKGKKAYPKASVREFEKRITEIKDLVSAVRVKGNRDYLTDGLQPFLHSIIYAFGADKFAFEDVYNYNLAVVSKAVADYETVWRRLRASEVKYFFGFVRVFGQYSYAEKSHSDPSLIDAVKVMTIHRAKGLEFPVVFIPGFIKEQKPRDRETFIDYKLYPVQKYSGTVEDDRRVYYTAITRSMKYLFITGSNHRYKEDGSPYQRSFDPHPFINEITEKAHFTDSLKIQRPKSSHLPRHISNLMFPTSFSDISTYRRCGHDYLMRNIYGYQAGVPAAFGYGTRIHNILNIIYNGYMKNRKIPQDSEIEQLFDKHFFLRYATQMMTDNMKTGAVRVVKNYVSLNSKDFDKVLETEKKFELVHDEALIKGQIDLLKKVDEKGNLDEVEVVDFKNENEQSTLYQRDYGLQLRLYALACLRALDLKPKKATIHHLDLGAGKDSKEDIDISEPMLDIASKEISETLVKIRDKNYRPNPTKDCESCDWSKICSNRSYL